MSDQVRCTCRRCTIRSLMGPAMIITIGVLFLLQQTRSGFSFGQTWPIILVAAGVINLASALAPMEGHIVPAAPPAVVPPPPVVPPQSSVPGAFPRQGQ
ncbi:MAG: DUF5668 domain-containing protein [Acidobacteriota bacterium]|nr:DUF5668 domain-containing protein [Acidobacteriota bacterium]